eukprot:gnl/Dysnectes_brevis/2726_a3311_578.p1 GENE.gnl/Dysnectes_brevis/2726_a3311_578~~gnl/Dysnectes_brevis/2726_a3311_578.p1  ORF type:complete len:4026 (+),score=1397.89 gnl/Dysnectes_brevis/2726_a3311_578:1420-12078(+)
MDDASVYFYNDYHELWIPYEHVQLGNNSLSLVALPDSIPTIPEAFDATLTRVEASEDVYSCQNSDYTVYLYDVLDSSSYYVEYDLSDILIHKWECGSSGYTSNSNIAFNESSGSYTVSTTVESWLMESIDPSEPQCYLQMLYLVDQSTTGPAILGNSLTMNVFPAPISPEYSTLISPLYKTPNSHALVKANFVDMCGNQMTNNSVDFVMRSNTTGDVTHTATVEDDAFYTQFDGAYIPADNYTITATMDGLTVTSDMIVADDLNNLQILRGWITSLLIVVMNMDLFRLDYGEIKYYSPLTLVLWDIATNKDGVTEVFFKDALYQFAEAHSIDIDVIISGEEKLSDADLSFRLGAALSVSDLDMSDYINLNSEINHYVDSAFDDSFYLSYEIHSYYNEDTGRWVEELVPTGTVDEEDHYTSSPYPWRAGGGIDGVRAYLDETCTFADALEGVFSFFDQVAGTSFADALDSWRAKVDEMPEDYTVYDAAFEAISRIDETYDTFIGSVVEDVLDLFDDLAEDEDILDGIGHILSFIDSQVHTDLYTRFADLTDTVDSLDDSYTFDDLLSEAFDWVDTRYRTNFTGQVPILREWISNVSSSDQMTLWEARTSFWDFVNLLNVMPYMDTTVMHEMDDWLANLNSSYTLEVGLVDYLHKLDNLTDSTNLTDAYNAALDILSNFSDDETFRELIGDVIFYTDDMVVQNLTGIFTNITTFIDGLDDQYTLQVAVEDILEYIDTQNPGVLDTYNTVLGYLEDISADETLRDGLQDIISFVDEFMGTSYVTTYNNITNFIDNLNETYTLEVGFVELLEYFDDNEFFPISTVDTYNSITGLLTNVSTDLTVMEAIEDVLQFVDSMTGSYYYLNVTTFIDGLEETYTIQELFDLALSTIDDKFGLPATSVSDALLDLIDDFADDYTLIDGLVDIVAAVDGFLGSEYSDMLSQLITYFEDMEDGYTVRQTFYDALATIDGMVGSNVTGIVEDIVGIVDDMPVDISFADGVEDILVYIDTSFGTNISLVFGNITNWLQNLSEDYTLLDGLEDILDFIDTSYNTPLLATLTSVQGFIDDMSDDETLLAGIQDILSFVDELADSDYLTKLTNITDWIDSIDQSYTFEDALGDILQYLDDTYMIPERDAANGYTVSLVSTYETIVDFLGVLADNDSLLDAVNDTVAFIGDLLGSYVWTNYSSIVSFITNLDDSYSLTDGLIEILSYLDSPEFNSSTYVTGLYSFIEEMAQPQTIVQQLADLVELIKSLTEGMYITKSSYLYNRLLSPSSNYYVPASSFPKRVDGTLTGSFENQLNVGTSENIAMFWASAAPEMTTTYSETLHFGTSDSPIYPEYETVFYSRQSIDGVDDPVLTIQRGDGFTDTRCDVSFSLTSPNGMTYSQLGTGTYVYPLQCEQESGCQYSVEYYGYNTGCEWDDTTCKECRAWLDVSISTPSFAQSDIPGDATLLSGDKDTYATDGYFIFIVESEPIPAPVQEKGVRWVADQLSFTTGRFLYTDLLVSDLLDDILDYLNGIDNTYNIGDYLLDMMDLLDTQIDMPDIIDYVTIAQDFMTDMADDSSVIDGIVDIAQLIDELAGTEFVSIINTALDDFEDLGADFTVLDGIEEVLLGIYVPSSDFNLSSAFDDLIGLIDDLAVEDDFVDGIHYILSAIDDLSGLSIDDYFTEFVNNVTDIAEDYTLADAIESLAEFFDMNDNTSFVDLIDGLNEFVDDLSLNYTLPDEVNTILEYVGNASSITVVSIIQDVEDWFTSDVLQGFTFSGTFSSISDFIDQYTDMTLFEIRDDILDFISEDLGFSFATIFTNINSNITSVTDVSILEILDNLQESIQSMLGFSLDDVFGSILNFADISVNDVLEEIETYLDGLTNITYTDIVANVTAFIDSYADLSVLDVIDEVTSYITGMAGNFTFADLFTQIHSAIEDYANITVRSLIDQAKQYIQDTFGDSFVIPTEFQDLVDLVDQYADMLMEDVMGQLDTLIDEVVGNFTFAALSTNITDFIEYYGPMECNITQLLQQAQELAYNTTGYTYTELMGNLTNMVTDITGIPVEDILQNVEDYISDLTDGLTFGDVVSQVSDFVESYATIPVVDLLNQVEDFIYNVTGGLTVGDVVEDVTSKVQQIADVQVLDIYNKYQEVVKNMTNNFSFTDTMGTINDAIVEFTTTTVNSVLDQVFDYITEQLGGFTFASTFTSVTEQIDSVGNLLVEDLIDEFEDGFNAPAGVADIIRGGQLQTVLREPSNSLILSAGVAIGGEDWRTSFCLSYLDDVFSIYVPTSPEYDNYTTITSTQNALMGEPIYISVFPKNSVGEPVTNQVVTVSVKLGDMPILTHVEVPEAQQGVHTLITSLDTEGVYTVTAHVGTMVVAESVFTNVAKVKVAFGGRDYYVSSIESVLSDVSPSYIVGEQIASSVVLKTADGSEINVELPVTASFDDRTPIATTFANPKHLISLTAPPTIGSRSLNVYVNGEPLLSQSVVLGLQVTVDAATWVVAYVSQYTQTVAETCGTETVSFTLQDVDGSVINWDLSSILTAGWDAATDLRATYDKSGAYKVSYSAPSSVGTHTYAMQLNGVPIDSRDVVLAQEPSSQMSTMDLKADLLIHRTTTITVIPKDACGTDLATSPAVHILITLDGSTLVYAAMSMTGPNAYTYTYTPGTAGQYVVEATVGEVTLPTGYMTVHPIPTALPTADSFTWDNKADGLFLAFPNITLSSGLANPLPCTSLLAPAAPAEDGVSRLGDAQCSVTLDGVYVLLDDATDFYLIDGDVLSFISDAPIQPTRVIGGEVIVGPVISLDDDENSFPVDYTGRVMPTVREDPDQNIKLPLMPCGILTIDLFIKNAGDCVPTISWSVDRGPYVATDSLEVELDEYADSTFRVAYIVDLCFLEPLTGDFSIQVGSAPAPSFTLPSNALVRTGESITLNPAVSLGCYWEEHKQDLTMGWTIPAALELESTVADNVLTVNTDTTVPQGVYSVAFAMTGPSIDESTTVTLTVDGDVSLSMLIEYPNIDHVGYLGYRTDLHARLIASIESAVVMDQATWTLTGTGSYSPVTGVSADFSTLEAGDYTLTVSVQKATGATLTLSTPLTVLTPPIIGASTLSGSSFTQIEAVGFQTTGAADAIGMPVDLRLWGTNSTDDVVLQPSVIDTSAELYLPQTGEFRLYLSACDSYSSCVEEYLGTVTITAIPPPAPEEDLSEVPVETMMALIASLGSDEQEGSWSDVDTETRIAMANNLTESILHEESEEEVDEISAVVLIVEMGLELELLNDSYTQIGGVIEDALETEVVTPSQARTLAAITDKLPDREQSRDVNLDIARMLAQGLDDSENAELSGSDVAPVAYGTSSSTSVDIENNDFFISADTTSTISTDLASLDMPLCSLNEGLVGCDYSSKVIAAEKDDGTSEVIPTPMASSDEIRRVTTRASVFLGITTDASATLDSPFTLSLSLLDTATPDQLETLSCLFYDATTDQWLQNGCSAELSLDGNGIDCVCSNLGTIAGFTSMPDEPEGGSVPWLYIIIGVVVVVGIAITLKFVLGGSQDKKKKKHEEFNMVSNPMSSNRAQLV